MKIAVPSMDDAGLEAEVSAHFGQAPFFTIVDTETGQVNARPSVGHQGDRTPGEAIAEAGVDLVLCGGMGQRAVQIFSAAGIEVCLGARGTVQDALDAYERGELSSAAEGGACPGHH